MRALFVMDPLFTVQVDKDSSYALMLEWQRRGGEVWHCGPRDLCPALKRSAFGREASSGVFESVITNSVGGVRHDLVVGGRARGSGVHPVS